MGASQKAYHDRKKAEKLAQQALINAKAASSILEVTKNEHEYDLLGLIGEDDTDRKVVWLQLKIVNRRFQLIHAASKRTFLVVGDPKIHRWEISEIMDGTKIDTGEVKGVLRKIPEVGWKSLIEVREVILPAYIVGSTPRPEKPAPVVKPIIETYMPPGVHKYTCPVTLPQVPLEVVEVKKDGQYFVDGPDGVRYLVARSGDPGLWYAWCYEDERKEEANPKGIYFIAKGWDTFSAIKEEVIRYVDAQLDPMLPEGV